MKKIYKMMFTAVAFTALSYNASAGLDCSVSSYDRSGASTIRDRGASNSNYVVFMVDGVRFVAQKSPYDEGSISMMAYNSDGKHLAAYDGVVQKDEVQMLTVFPGQMMRLHCINR